MNGWHIPGLARSGRGAGWRVAGCAVLGAAAVAVLVLALVAGGGGVRWHQVAGAGAAALRRRPGPGEALVAQLADQNRTLGSLAAGVSDVAARLERVQRALGAGGPLFINAEVAARNITAGGATLTVLALARDEVVGGSILRQGVAYEAGSLAFMMDQVRPGSAVVDAGCNFGSYSIFFAARAGPGGAVHCFEPQRKMAQLASANSLVNGLSGVMAVHNAALSFAPGRVEMAADVPDGTRAGERLSDLEARHGPINYGGMPLGRGGEGAVAVTLDSLGLINISFIKVDVQGAEPLMFYGAKETIAREMPVVVYESLEGYNITKDMVALRIPPEVQHFDVAAFLGGLGYTATRMGLDIVQRPPSAHQEAISSPFAPAAAAATAGSRGTGGRRGPGRLLLRPSSP